MPVYKGVLKLEDNGPDTPTIHLFDYCDVTQARNGYKREIIAMESCIYLGYRKLSSIRPQISPSPGQSQLANAPGSSQSANSTNEVQGKPTNSEEDQGKMKAKQNQEKEEKKKVERDVNGEEEKKEVKEKENIYLEKGQEFQGQILKCPNGPYDYAIKLWDTGKTAPSEDRYPREGEEEAAVVLERREEVVVVGCGSNVAFVRNKTFLRAGVDPDDLSLPFARLRVSLHRLGEREPMAPVAAWEAIPTQVAVAPYDVY